MALCVHGVQRGGGAVLNEACAAELLNISPAWKKFGFFSSFCFCFSLFIFLSGI